MKRGKVVKEGKRQWGEEKQGKGKEAIKETRVNKWGKGEKGEM